MKKENAKIKFFEEVKDLKTVFVWDIVAYTLNPRKPVFRLEEYECKFELKRAKTYIEILAEYYNLFGSKIVVSVTPAHFNVPLYEYHPRSRDKKITRFFKDRERAMNVIALYTKVEGIKKAKEHFLADVDKYMQEFPEDFF